MRRDSSPTNLSKRKSNSYKSLDHSNVFLLLRVSSNSEMYVNGSKLEAFSGTFGRRHDNIFDL